MVFLKPMLVAKTDVRLKNSSAYRSLAALSEFFT